MAIPEWLPKVHGVFNLLGVPHYIWMPIMFMESGGDPNAKGDGGLSLGLFQTYTAGGQGDGHDLGKLLDPIYNAAVAAPAIARAYKQYGEDFLKVAMYSGHPNANIKPGMPEYDNVTRHARMAEWLKANTNDYVAAWNWYQTNTDIPNVPGDDNPGGARDGGDNPYTDPTQPTPETVPDTVDKQTKGILDAIKQMLYDLANSLGANLETGLHDWGPPVGAVVLGIAFLAIAVNGFMKSTGVSVKVGG